MPRFHDPRAPEHRVVFGGIEFVGGVTADIDPDLGTRELFAGAGIVEVTDGTPDAPDGTDPVPDGTPDPPKPAPRKRK
jgi:hypothetical protein